MRYQNQYDIKRIHLKSNSCSTIFVKERTDQND